MPRISERVQRIKKKMHFHLQNDNVQKSILHSLKTKITTTVILLSVKITCMVDAMDRLCVEIQHKSQKESESQYVHNGVKRF